MLYNTLLAPRYPKSFIISFVIHITYSLALAWVVALGCSSRTLGQLAGIRRGPFVLIFHVHLVKFFTNPYAVGSMQTSDNTYTSNQAME